MNDKSADYSVHDRNIKSTFQATCYRQLSGLMATDIKQSATFEEAATRYHSDYTVNFQSDRWVALSALPHNIDKDTVKAGDVYGVEKILSGEEYYHPMVKIYQVKVLAQVRPSDAIYQESDHSS